MWWLFRGSMCTWLSCTPALCGSALCANRIPKSILMYLFGYFMTYYCTRLLGRAKGGGGKTYRKAKPREDGLSETIFRDPPKLVSEAVS